MMETYGIGMSILWGGPPSYGVAITESGIVLQHPTLESIIIPFKDFSKVIDRILIERDIAAMAQPQPVRDSTDAQADGVWGSHRTDALNVPGHDCDVPPLSAGEAEYGPGTSYKDGVA